MNNTPHKRVHYNGRGPGSSHSRPTPQGSTKVHGAYNTNLGEGLALTTPGLVTTRLLVIRARISRLLIRHMPWIQDSKATMHTWY